MNRISRISQSIGAAVSAVKCPGCNQRVVPTIVGGTPAGESNEGRWSFIWVAPRGAVCPENQFPLARYARRAKWLRLLFLGIASLAVTASLFVLQIIGGPTSTMSTIVRVLGTVGALLLVVGLVGVIVGGRRTPEL